jgi:hypothetical protein
VESTVIKEFTKKARIDFEKPVLAFYLKYIDVLLFTNMKNYWVNTHSNKFIKSTISNSI